MCEIDTIMSFHSTKHAKEFKPYIHGTLQHTYHARKIPLVDVRQTVLGIHGYDITSSIKA